MKIDLSLFSNILWKESTMNSDLRRALAQLDAQPHSYFSGPSAMLKGHRFPILGKSRIRPAERVALVFVIRNFTDPGSIRVEIYIKPKGEENRSKAWMRPRRLVVERVELGAVFQRRLSKWLDENTINGLVPAEAFFKGGMDIATAFSRPISIVHIHGQGRQEERQFSPCRVH